MRINFGSDFLESFIHLLPFITLWRGIQIGGNKPVLCVAIGWLFWRIEFWFGREFN
jgi:hypothetical protein